MLSRDIQTRARRTRAPPPSLLPWCRSCSALNKEFKFSALSLAPGPWRLTCSALRPRCRRARWRGSGRQGRQSQPRPRFWRGSTPSDTRRPRRLPPQHPAQLQALHRVEEPAVHGRRWGRLKSGAYGSGPPSGGGSSKNVAEAFVTFAKVRKHSRCPWAPGHFAPVYVERRTMGPTASRQIRQQQQPQWQPPRLACGG